MTYNIINSDPGHTHSKQQLNKNLKITFASPPKGTMEKEKKKNKKKKKQLQRFALHAYARRRKKQKATVKRFALQANVINTSCLYTETVLSS